MEFIIFVLVAANLTVTITLATYVQRCMEVLLGGIKKAGEKPCTTQ